MAHRIQGAMITGVVKVILLRTQRNRQVEEPHWAKNLRRGMAPLFCLGPSSLHLQRFGTLEALPALWLRAFCGGFVTDTATAHHLFSLQLLSSSWWMGLGAKSSKLNPDRVSVMTHPGAYQEKLT